MRLKPLFYILLIVATAGFVAADDPPPPPHVKVDDQNDGGGVTGPGCSETTNPPCDEEGDTLGGGGGPQGPPGCVYSQDLGPNAFENYMNCLLYTFPPGVEGTLSDLDDYPTITVQDEFGNPPPTLCFYESSRDIQSTSLSLFGPRKHGKILKLTEQPAGDGQIIVTVNNRTYTVDTEYGTTDRGYLNRRIAELLDRHFRVWDIGESWRIYGEYPKKLGLMKPITRIGIKSTDSAIYKSGIALLPFNVQFAAGGLCGGL